MAPLTYGESIQLKIDISMELGLLAHLACIFY